MLETASRTRRRPAAQNLAPALELLPRTADPARWSVIRGANAQQMMVRLSPAAAVQWRRIVAAGGTPRAARWTGDYTRSADNPRGLPMVTVEEVTGGPARGGGR
jgi:hypothetical protein